MVLFQYGILEMTNKIEQQHFRSVHEEWSKCGVLIEMALVVHAKIFTSDIQL
jgi:hypothetical protein